MENVLFIHSSSELYGSDKSLLNIVRNLNHDEYKIYVMLPSEGPLLNELRQIDSVQTFIYEVAVLRRKNLSLSGGIKYFFGFVKSYRFIKHFIKENNIDIVDTNTAVVFPGAVAAKGTKAKSVWHIREIIKNNFENRVISFMMNRYADIIIANSKATGEALKVNQNKVRVIYNAVDEKENTNDTNLIREFPVVGMAGRINRWKGQKLFVDVAELVQKDFPDIKFVIAGDAYAGEEYLTEDLQQYINDKHLNETVYMLGEIKDMDSFYKSLDVFLLPSIQPEPFGLVIIEAMEHSVPVIATRHGGPMEIITDGVDGYLADFTDPTEMANKVETLLSNRNLRNEIGISGKRKKREMFSMGSMITKIERVFSEIVNN